MKMKNQLLLLFLLLSTLGYGQVTGFTKPVIESNAITKDLMSWLYYERDHLEWSSDYIPLDSVFKEMDKNKFLGALAEGGFLPLKFTKENGVVYYQLHAVNNLDESIADNIQRIALAQFRYAKLYGKELPSFNYVDLKGNVFNAETAKGKIVVINCWYISCGACVAEMPELNLLVDAYKERTDVLFVSLALDNAVEIKQFLKKHTFKYAIVPNKESYLTNELNIELYPTQIVVDRQSKIVKLIDGPRTSELKALIEKVVNQPLL